MNRPKLSLIAQNLVLAIFCCALMGDQEGTQGSYKVTFKGCFTGTGNAAVSAKKVNLNADITDQNGNTAHIVIHLPLDRGCFAGADTILGQFVTFSGRVDPPDDTLPHARIGCTMVLGSGDTARFAGVR